MQLVNTKVNHAFSPKLVGNQGNHSVVKTTDQFYSVGMIAKKTKNISVYT